MSRPDYYGMAHDDPDGLIEELLGDGYDIEEAHAMICYMLSGADDLDDDDDCDDDLDYCDD